MLDDDDPPHEDELRRRLLEELRSIRPLLEEGQSKNAAKHDDIPMLVDVVDAPRDQKPAAIEAAPRTRNAMRDAMVVDTDRLVDDLLDEFLPQIESRLRELLQARLQQLTRTTPQKK